MALKTPVELVKGAIEAFNAKDEAKLLEMCAVESTYVDVPTEREIKGHEAIFGFFAEMYTAYPDVSCRIVEMLPFENKVGVEMIVTGTHTGELKTPLGIFPPTGKPFTFRGFQVHTVTDGKIVSTLSFYDQATIMLQLGLIPEQVLVPA